MSERPQPWVSNLGRTVEKFNTIDKGFRFHYLRGWCFHQQQRSVMPIEMMYKKIWDVTLVLCKCRDISSAVVGETPTTEQRKHLPSSQDLQEARSTIRRWQISSRTANAPSRCSDVIIVTIASGKPGIIERSQSHNFSSARIS